ncbi:MAG TPA: amino acid permease [Streptosporangiaceae bacterium]|nr:amino acid permease [Streptosporangiaceae bacterium]
MADSAVPAAPAAPSPAGTSLFVRQSSGLVREVSVLNALFYNCAAFIGTGVGWYTAFYGLAFLPVGLFGPFSTYGWAAIITAAFGILLGLIFASLATVMPRSGGDYVFTSRFIPKAGPFLGWLEGFTLCFASLAVIAFEIPVILRNLQLDGLIVWVGTGSSFFKGAANWFSQAGSITEWPGFISSLVVLALVVLVVIQPTKRLHRIVSVLAACGVGAAILMFVAGLPLISPSHLDANIPKFTGMSVAEIQKAAVTTGVSGHGVNFGPSTLSIFIFLVLFNYIGFQYSAYIAGEVRGNIKRGIMIAVLGALSIGVLMNSVYIDLLSKRLGFQLQLGWSALFWSSSPHTPLGEPNAAPLLAAMSRPGAWPLFLLINFFGGILPFVLIPVYINFMSRIMLAWGLDRQIPSWFCAINERVRAPLNAILTLVGISVVLVVFENFAFLPTSVAAGGKLNLAGSAWFSGLCALLAWLMPGVNAILAPFTRPDLLRSAPWRRWLPVMGVLWLAFGAIVYWYAGIDLIIKAVKGLTGSQVTTYLNTSGVTFTLAVIVIGIVIYFIRDVQNRVRGIDLSLLYKTVPPD